MDSKAIVFADFARRAAEKIQERKKARTCTVYVPDLEGNITLRGLTDQEWIDIRDGIKNDTDQDKYAVFTASPELQETAGIMVDNGMLQDTQRFRICDMFCREDIRFLIGKIIDLSGLNEETKIEEVEETKN